MGADLYIPAIDNVVRDKYMPRFNKAVAAREKHMRPHGCRFTSCEEAKELQSKVEKISEQLWDKNPGYFRDSYNNSNLLWRMGMSWWQNPFITKTGNLPPTRAKKFLAAIKNTPITIGSLAEDNWWKGMPTTQKEEWLDHWEKNKLKLIKFLETAIELKETIRCSI